VTGKRIFIDHLVYIDQRVKIDERVPIYILEGINWLLDTKQTTADPLVTRLDLPSSNPLVTPLITPWWPQIIILFYLLQFFVLHFNLNTRLQWLREIFKGAQVQSTCNTIAAPLEMLPRHRLYRTLMTPLESPWWPSSLEPPGWPPSLPVQRQTYILIKYNFYMKLYGI
jgi:hypothetical protein